MIAAVRSGLIDPNSALYGAAHVVGNAACLTVNAKNRLGGYSGNQEALLVRDTRTKRWVSGGTNDVPHELCLEALARR
jgi:hypothetical protein